MKTTAIVGVVSLGLLMGAQVAQGLADPLKATVTKRSVTQMSAKEKGWSLVFDIAVSGCQASRGSFDFMVEVASGRSTPQLVQQTADFSTSRGEATTLTVTYQPKPGWEVKNVTGILVKSLSCPPE